MGARDRPAAVSAVEWGTVGEWFGGTMAAGAVLAALWAVHGETKARERLEARLDEERRLADERLARRVMLVADTIMAHHSTPEGEDEWYVMVDFEVDNRGDQPIIDVVVTSELRGGPFPQRLHEVLARKLDAQSAASSWIKLGVPGPPANQADVLESVLTTVAFTDAEGRRWSTEGPGHLERVGAAA